MAQELTTQKRQYFVKLYTSRKESGTFRTLAEVAEGEGYSASAMGQILKDAGVEITRGKRATRNEYVGKITGRSSRVVITMPKLRTRRLKLKISGHSVSEVLGVYPLWVSNLENNMLRPTPERIRAYADALDALDPKRTKSTTALALARCRDFQNSEGVKKTRQKRKTREGSWAEYVEDLTFTERNQLSQALKDHADDWRAGKRADKLGRTRGVNKRKMAGRERAA
jgi:transcriptional regulator with XRE-family HTH domain